jgi:hypothetical protein
MLQCLSAVKYLHSHNLVGHGIRLSNILMPNEKSIKIGIIKDRIQNDWKKKDDIDMLYKYFVLMMFPMTFKPGKGILSYLPDPVNNEYDKKLREIIYDMDTNNITIEDIFKTTINYYIKKYLLTETSKNTSIKTVFKCLSEYKKLNDGLNKVSSEAISLIRQLYQDISQMKEKYYLSIEELRRWIALEYPSFDTNNELNPNIIIDFLFKAMKDEKILDGDNEKNILDYFSLVKKIVKKCKGCDEEKASFESDNIVTFYFKKVPKTFDLINHGFSKTTMIDHTDEKIFCEKCLAYQGYIEEISYHNFNKYLIIYFNRGKDDEINTEVDFKKEIELIKIINSSNKIKYKLQGGINLDRENRKFENSIIQNSNKSIIMLFYEISN